METGWIWLGAMIFLLVLELYFPIFLPLCLAAGCLCTAVAAFMDLPFYGMITSFILGAMATYLIMKPYSDRNKPKPEDFKDDTKI